MPAERQSEPSDTDPRVTAALEAQERLGEAMQAGDVDAIDQLFAADMLVNAPINRAVNRANVMARYRAGEISYEPGWERKIEIAAVQGESVVIMGEEIVRPIAGTPHAGKTVRRRFTDVWQNLDGVWKLGIRQGTIASID